MIAKSQGTIILHNYIIIFLCCDINKAENVTDWNGEQLQKHDPKFDHQISPLLQIDENEVATSPLDTASSEYSSTDVSFDVDIVTPYPWPWYYGKQIPCRNGTIYSSYDECVEHCKKRRNNVKFNYTVDIYKGLPKYKIVLFSSADFFLNTDDELVFRANEKKFVNGSYFIDESGEAHTCYPFTSYFTSCPYRIDILTDDLIEKKYTYTKKHSYQINYNIDEYFLFFNGDKNVGPVGLLVITCDKIKKVRLVIGPALSVAALLVTLVLMHFVKELKKSSNTTLKCHIFMLFLYFILVTIWVALTERSSTFCLITCIMQQYFWLSAFCWMNIQAFDLFRTLQSPGHSSGRKTRNRRTFIIHSLVAWGLPFVIAGFTLMAELLELPNVNPKFRQYCWFQFRSAQAFLYMYGWMALSVLLNIILFIFILHKFRHLSKDIAVVNKNIYKQLMMVSIKLVVLLGVFWMFKILFWAYGGPYPMETDGLYYLDYFLDFQGVFIFIIYVCKPSLLKKSCCRNKSIDFMESSSQKNVSTLTVSTLSIMLQYGDK